MNKKLFFGMFAAAGMLFVTSCSNDELDVVQSGNEAQVTFSLGLEGGIATRAISDGTGADVLMYAVFDNEGERISTIKKVEKTGITFPATENITLAKGQTYKVAFWAQDGDCKAYTVSDEMNVTVNYANDENKVNNDETRDAFFKTVEFTVQGDQKIDVELKRPFAQINVGVTAEDWNAAVASGITIKNSSVVIKNAATSINLLTGEVGEETDDVVVSYDLAAIPDEKLQVDTDGNDVKEEYHWLSMSYILVADRNGDTNNNGVLGDERATLESLAYTFNPESGNDITFADGLNSVPVQRNWRTNILGKILTGDIQFNITIDPVYDGDINYPDGQAQELEFAATFGGEVTLEEDVTLDKLLVVAADMVLNLNGKTLTGTRTYQKATMQVEEGVTLTVKGGTISSTGKNGGSAIVNKGTLIVENATLNGAPYDAEKYNGYDWWPSYAFSNDGGNARFTNTTFNSFHGAVASGGTGAVATLNNCVINVTGIQGKTSHGMYTYDGGSIVVNDGIYANNAADQNSTGGTVINGEVTVNAGTFTGRIGGTPVFYGGEFSVNPEAYVADGYTAVDNGNGTWTVAKELTSSNLASVFANLSTTEPTTIAVAENIVIEAPLAIPAGAEVTVELGANEITSATTDAFVVNEGATLTIKGNGTVKSNGAPIRAIGGKVIVEGGTFTQTGAWNTATSTYRYCIDSREGGEVIIKGGTFNTNNGLISVTAGSSFVIDGGEFTFENNTGGTRHFAYVAGNLTINDGVFRGVADSGAGGCFFCGAASTCNIQVNGGEFTSLWTSGSVNRIFESYASDSYINVTGGLFNTNGGIASFVEANTDDATKAEYPYKAK